MLQKIQRNLLSLAHIILSPVVAPQKIAKTISQASILIGKPCWMQKFRSI